MWSESSRVSEKVLFTVKIHYAPPTDSKWFDAPDITIDHDDKFDISRV